MLKTKKIKKIIAFIFIAITLFSTAQPILAVSNTGTGKWVSGQWDSNVFTTDNKTSVGMLIRRLVNYTTGERVTVFCSEHGIESPTGEIHTATHSIPTDPTIKRACKVAFFGWYQKYGDYVIDGGIMAESMKNVKLHYVFTQQMVWETLGQSNATFRDADLQNQYNSFKADVNAKIENMERKPSFCSSTITVEMGETKIVTDSNNVLSNYVSFDKTVDGIRITHNKGENTLNVTVNADCTSETIRILENTMFEWGIIKEETQNNNSTVFFTFKEGVQNQLYALNYNDPVTMSLSLKVNMYGKIELTKLDTQNALVDGAIYTVTGDNYNKDITVTGGRIIVDKLKTGIYTIREKSAPHGYLLNTETYTVEVKPNETSKQSIINAEPTGSIGISKRDSKTGTVAQGDATFQNAVYKVYADEDIYNVARTKKWYSKGDLVATRNTNKKGACEDVTNLPLGKYIVKEEVTPIGYLIDKNVYEIDLKYKDQYTKVITGKADSTDKVKEMRVHIFKSGIKENSGETPGLSGAEFTIKLNSAVERAFEQGYIYAEIWNGIDEYGNKVEVDSKRVAEAQIIAPTYETIVTDENGDAYTENVLPYGTFIVKETVTPKDYETATDFTFSITDDESEIEDIAKKVKNIVVNNEQLETYIKLIKKDLKTEKIVSLNSATFQIKATKDIYDRATGKNLYKKGEAISQKIGSTVYTSFTTNARNLVVPDKSYNNNKEDLGSIVTPLQLEVGTYEITEIRTPQGFLQLENPVQFKVDGIRNYDKDNEGDYIKEVVVKNEQPTGTLIVDKSVALRENIDISIVDISDLSGIEFSLTAKENIIDYSDGSIIYKKEQLVKKYNLDKNGDLTVQNLPMGIYELQETKTINGLVLNDKKYEIKFEQNDLVTKVYEVKQDISNDTTILEISKTGITGDKELVGAKLTVIDENDNIIDTWTSTENTYKIEGLIVGKTYTLREEIAPDEFVRATDIQFEILNTLDIQKIVMVDKIVTMTKEDIAGKEIEGAELKVLDKNGELIDSWISTNEPHKIKGLIEGESYILCEDYAPDGFVISSQIEFTVSQNKETQKIKMVDKVLEVIKTDLVAGEEIEGAELKVIDEDGNIIDEWTSSKEPHRVVGLEENKTYKLVEITAPYGYEITEEIEFTVSEDKETQRVEMKDMPILQNIKLVKVDSNTKEVIKDKFTFGIYEDAECSKLIKEVKSDKENGTVLFTDLRYGTYYIKEITAPKGYVLSDKVIKVEMNDKGTFIDNEKVESENSTFTLEFENAPIDTPKTGDNSNLKLYAGLLGLSLMALASIGVHECKKRKSVNNK